MVQFVQVGGGGDIIWPGGTELTPTPAALLPLGVTEELRLTGGGGLAWLMDERRAMRVELPPAAPPPPATPPPPPVKWKQS